MSVQAALRDSYTYPIRDPLWGHIYLRPELGEIVKAPPFMRLHRIMQLGPVNLVYPGATHTRAGHSIGVFYLARRLLLRLAERGAEDWLTPTGVHSFLAASLLHDTGHFPYTHSLKQLPLLSHEELTGRAIQSEPLRSLVGKSGADPDMTAAIVDTGIATNNGETHFYRRLLSGALDPDKLDYLNRDARYAGVPYGAQDVDFVLSRVEPHKERGIDIDSRAIPSVESLLFSKYLMYRAVYWHRNVRSATAMIKKALDQGLERKVIDEEELYGLDDAGLFSLLKERSRNLRILELGERVREGKVFETVLEFSFDELEAHSEYLSRAKEEDAIIDVPEPVSFETGLFVLDEGRMFSESSTVFKSGTVEAFNKALRTVRIFSKKK